MTNLNIMKDEPIRIQKILAERMERTPDLLELRKTKNRVAVFVYGTLKVGYSNHDFYLKESDYLGTARTLNPDYKMFSAGGGAYPAIFEDKARGGHIYGEVFSVDLDTLMDLDDLESNGWLYNRVKIPITLLDQKVGLQGVAKNPIIHCYAYLGGLDAMKDRLIDDQKLKILDNKPAGYIWEKRKYS